jgi:hypothetical protein
MTKTYFWDLVRAKGPVGSPRDRDRTTIPYSEHENVLLNVMFRGEVAFDFGDIGNSKSELNENDDGLRDDGLQLSIGTNDKVFLIEHMTNAKITKAQITIWRMSWRLYFPRRNVNS